MSRLAGIGVGAALLAACEGSEPDGGPDRLRALVTRPPADTARFTASAVARRCAGDRREILLEAASPRGSGVLLVLRGVDTSAAGTYPLIALGDSLTPRGAQVAARFVLREQVHAFALDSGVIAASGDLRGGFDAHVAGWGLDGTVRTHLVAEFQGVPAREGDTTSCAFQ